MSISASSTELRVVYPSLWLFTFEIRSRYHYRTILDESRSRWPLFADEAGSLANDEIKRLVLRYEMYRPHQVTVRANGQLGEFFVKVWLFRRETLLGRLAGESLESSQQYADIQAGMYEAYLNHLRQGFAKQPAQAFSASDAEQIV